MRASRHSDSDVLIDNGWLHLSRGSVVVSDGVIFLAAVVIAILIGIHYERSTSVLKVYLETRTLLGRRRRAAMKEGRRMIVILSLAFFVLVLAKRR